MQYFMATAPTKQISIFEILDRDNTVIELIMPANAASLPLPEKIYESIKLSIKFKVLNPGDKLPTREQLAAIFGVSVSTISEANKKLISEGYLLNKHKYLEVQERPESPEEKFIKEIKGWISDKGITFVDDPRVRNGNDEYQFTVTDVQLTDGLEGPIKIVIW